MPPRASATPINFLRLITAFLLILTFSGCATVHTVTVPTRQELFTKKELAEKNCYNYDTQKDRVTRNLKTAVPLGLIGLLSAPFGPVLAAIGGGAAIKAEQATLPTKCSLTIDEAERAAAVMAFAEDTAVVWYRVKDDASLALRATPTGKNGQCTVQSLEITKTTKDQARMFTRVVEVCAGKNGVATIKEQKKWPNASATIYAKETAVENKKPAANSAER